MPDDFATDAVANNDVTHDDLAADIRSLTRTTGTLSRRGFVATSLATGFTLAAGPIHAQSVITTDAEGLVAGEVKIPVADGQMPVYRSRPAGGANHPVVLVVQEIFGVHEHIKDICRRFAKLGYLALAPELYARQADMSTVKTLDEARVVAAKVPDKQVLSDLDATAKWATAAEGGSPSKLAITGFCWGGRIVWLYAAHNPQVKAGVAWYGRLVGQASELTPKHPLDVVAELKAPVLGLYGGADAGIPQDTVEKMRGALKAAGKTAEIVVYPDAPHAFHADYRPSYRAGPAKDGWKRLKEWFERHGVSAA
jgi:carboxymethylenebutenolidase